MDPQLALTEDTVNMEHKIASWASAKFQPPKFSSQQYTLLPRPYNLIPWHTQHQSLSLHRTSRGEVDLLMVGKCGAYVSVHTREPGYVYLHV